MNRRTAHRTGRCRRDTKETRIRAAVDLDGTGRARVATGIGFFDHMLDLFARHGLFDLALRAEGDLHVDQHHTVEDAGIALGTAFRAALGDRRGIARYGWAFAPMDESLARVAVDLGGRPYLVFRAELPRRKVGGFDAELVREFFQAFANQAGANVHAELLYGGNTHHRIEALFKALARALRAAAARDPRERGVPSTKGRL
jgi:imidazoleglycerol-phosphate dehydratase